MFHIYDIKLYSLCHWVYQPWLLSPTQIHNFHHFSQTLPDWLYYGLFASVYFTFTFQVVRSVIQNNCVWCRNICVWCNIIVLEVSCKYHLTWWIMPFVVAAGLILRILEISFVCLACMLQRLWWWNHLLSGFLSVALRLMLLSTVLLVANFCNIRPYFKYNYNPFYVNYWKSKSVHF